MGKPLVIGEFATSCSESVDAKKNYQYLYNAGYSGALSWQYNEGGGCADKRWQANQGMSSLNGQSWNGKIRVGVY